MFRIEHLSPQDSSTLSLDGIETPLRLGDIETLIHGILLDVSYMVPMTYGSIWEDNWNIVDLPRCIFRVAFVDQRHVALDLGSSKMVGSLLARVPAHSPRRYCIKLTKPWVKKHRISLWLAL